MTMAHTAGPTPIGARPPRDRLAGAAADRPSSAPVIVLASPYFGADPIRAVLEGRPELACTAGTGLLPLSEQALATWRNADGRLTGTPSSLAVTSTRALATSVIVSILAREGKPRWCEVATAGPPAAEAFLRLYPQTQFLCLYRSCPGVIRAVLDASPWGITDPLFASLASRFPGNTVASLTAYWVTVTAPLLGFEREHPRSCLRVRFEDLGQDRQAEGRIASFLGLGEAVGRPVPGLHDEPGPASVGRELAADVPGDLVPPGLLEQANDLLGQLDYPPMGASQE